MALSCKAKENAGTGEMKKLLLFAWDKLDDIGYVIYRICPRRKYDPKNNALIAARTRGLHILLIKPVYWMMDRILYINEKYDLDIFDDKDFDLEYAMSGFLYEDYIDACN